MNVIQEDAIDISRKIMRALGEVTGKASMRLRAGGVEKAYHGIAAALAENGYIMAEMANEESGIATKKESYLVVTGLTEKGREALPQMNDDAFVKEMIAP